MAMDRRGYFYRSRRVGGRVVRDYFGKGPIAEMAAHLMDKMHQARASRAQNVARLDKADASFRQFHDQLDQILAAHFLAAGFHRHDRGPWRKRRDAI